MGKKDFRRPAILLQVLRCERESRVTLPDNSTKESNDSVWCRTVSGRHTKKPGRYPGEIRFAAAGARLSDTVVIPIFNNIITLQFDNKKIIELLLRRSKSRCSQNNRL